MTAACARWPVHYRAFDRMSVDLSKNAPRSYEASGADVSRIVLAGEFVMASSGEGSIAPILY